MNETPATKPSHRLEWLIWGALVLTVLAIASAFIWTRLEDGGIG